ncbi:MAG: 50S ribosomal protein L22 [Firmicutes bacterium ADurb.Bin193]|nr:MAG: 50S ribosomal protein L22 [Firmicutes bacterium ADurb.Bin193]
MQSTAVAKVNHLRISAQKVKIVIDLIRNKPVGEALAILRNTPKAASGPVEKLLLSAVANAENNHNMSADSLYVAEVYANQGPTMKRIQPRAQGRAFRILKRTSHVTIVLKEKDWAEAAPAKPAPKKAETKKAAPAEETAKKAAPKKADSKKTDSKKADSKKTDVAEDAKVETEQKSAEVKKPRAPRKKADTATEKTAKSSKAKKTAAPDEVQE